ncbi:MAG: MHYT domain-containing protein [Oceanococcus sp.]
MKHSGLTFLQPGTDLSLAMQGSYNWWWVLLSLLIASAAAFTALQISERLMRGGANRAL